MSKRDEKMAATAWLACDLAELADELDLAHREPHADEDDMDVVIIGSGYGGSVALDMLAGCSIDGRPLRIAMLERGREYVPGSFPASEADLAGHARFSTAGSGEVRGEASGLFDLRLGPDVNVVLANGLGGGSLINAGVMEPPLASVFADPRWPKALREAPPSPQDFAEARTRLMAVSSAWLDQRQVAMERLREDGSAKVIPVHITVADADDASGDIQKCRQCGDCATGCNFKAKLSVDVSLIAKARRRHPREHLRIVTGATAIDLRQRSAGGWEVGLVHTETALRRHQRKGFLLRARRVIIAAGTLGSTELLARARDSELTVSPRLGAGFSTNGDLISLVCDTGVPTHAVADEQVGFNDRGVGPTITRMIDRRDDPGVGGVIQDLGVPGPLRRLFAECATTGLVIDSLACTDATVHRRGEAPADPAGVDRELISRSMAIAVIADDDAKGWLTLPASTPRLEQGTLGVVWPELRGDLRQEARQDRVAELIRAATPEAKVLPNPVWRPLSKPLEDVFGKTRGPAITVHPLGGCAMGDSFATSVVNDRGQVHDNRNGVHDGLVVLDGSIVPTALGINPALTIATLAQRAMRALLTEWNIVPANDPPAVAWPPRPVYAVPDPVPPNEPTMLAITEKMVAKLAFATASAVQSFDVELELWFDSIAVGELIDAQGSRVLHVDAKRSRMRVLPLAQALPSDLPIGGLPAAQAQPVPVPHVVAPVSGTLTIMRHDSSSLAGRRTRALMAWLRNRGLRDLAQAIADKAARRPGKGSGILKSTWSLASRAGAVRLLEYDLRLGSAEMSAGGADAGLGRPAHWSAQRIRAHKRLTYEAGGNPVRQLMEAAIEEFPRLVPAACEPLLKVSPTHFFHTGVPLVRIDRQRSAPAALLDLASLGAYLARVLLPLHLLTLRLPDRPDRAPQRLPADLSRHRAFAPLAITELQVDERKDAGIVKIRLSRYRPDVVTRANPVLLLHGYSASGTTFVHETLPGGGLVGALCKAGHDVWVLDMRSSAGMPTAQVHWTFEQMGCNDIPVAVNHIVENTGAAKVDIVAHCMGATMLTLGLLLPLDKLHVADGMNPRLTKKMRDRIGKLVFSQAGPTLEARPANQARSYIFQWIRHYMRLGDYEFTPAAPNAADDMLDRLLCAVPYPARDFARENPFGNPLKRTPWVGARHRMDALYGITFDLQGVDDAVLDRIDDFFGPMNLDTVAQVIAFARGRLVTDAQGNADFNSYRAFRRFADSPVLSLHATANGLFDFMTRDLARSYFNDAGMQGHSVALEGFGHQDSLIGRNAPEVYALIVNFLRPQP